MTKSLKKNRAARIVFGSLAFLAIVGLYIFYLDYQIKSKFEFHRWNLPSRVYSSPFYLYPGLIATPKNIADRLSNLGYRLVSKGVSSPGEYIRAPGRMIVFLRGFAYPDGKEEARPLSIVWDGDVVSSISRMDTSEELSTARLEPELIASIFDEKMEDRTLVKLTDVPENLTKAIVAIEDERFYSHFGIDLIAITRALLTDIIHMRIVQGGSTLTQQLVKNYFLTNKKTFVRKLNEAVMAILLERRYSKDEILESYLNEIYLGQKGAASVSGVGEAARHYFGKDVNQLSLAECALLAGIIRSPGRYSPFNNPENALERRDFVLEAMYEKEIISERAYKQARLEKIHAKAGTMETVRAPFFIDFVQRQLKEDFPEDKLKSEGLKIFTTLDMYAQVEAERAVRSGLNRLEEDYPYLKQLIKQRVETDSMFHLEGALIALESQTGYIRAFVGGRDYSVSQFNRAVDAKRQPGSAFKPFIYLTALDPDLSDTPFMLSSILDDSPLKMESGDEMWEPKNYDEEFHGNVPLRTALEKSYNVASSRLAIAAGLKNVVKTAEEAGIESPLKPYPSIALGAFEVTPLELATAYSIFPTGGIRSDPIAILQVETPDGDVLTQRSLKVKRVFSASTIYLVNSLLKGVIDNGTAASAKLYGLEGLYGGKTGTTSDYKDAWFIGFNTKLLALTWVGFDTGEETKLTGTSGALPIWVDFMKSVAPVLKDEDFSATDDIVLIKIDPENGMLANKRCPKTRFEAFRSDVVPQKVCTLHN